MLACAVAYDAIGELTISRRFGFLEDGSDPADRLGDIDREFEYRGVVCSTPRPLLYE